MDKINKLTCVVIAAVLLAQLLISILILHEVERTTDVLVGWDLVLE